MAEATEVPESARRGRRTHRRPPPQLLRMRALARAEPGAACRSVGLALAWAHLCSPPRRRASPAAPRPPPPQTQRLLLPVRTPAPALGVRRRKERHLLASATQKGLEGALPTRRDATPRATHLAGSLCGVRVRAGACERQSLSLGNVTATRPVSLAGRPSEPHWLHARPPRSASSAEREARGAPLGTAGAPPSSIGGRASLSLGTDSSACVQLASAAPGVCATRSARGTRL